MKKIILPMVTLIVFWVLTGCTPSLEESQTAFCQDLAAYGQAVNDLQNINADTTVEELETARENVTNARQEMLDSAGDLREAQLSRVEEAWDNAQNEIENISGEATLGEAAAKIRGQALILATEIERAQNVNCLRR